MFSTSAHIFYAKPASKKGPVVEEKALLGRPSNNLKIGILGVPNIGKSTFFNALTNSSVPAENFPFCTIAPSEARVVVPDTRFDWLVDHYHPQKETPAYLT
ncbi:Obg-like ATPase, partial [Podila clonocystis]